ncbi:MAG TPA: hypothetical protein VN327_03040 [Pseudonocardiaceae bacterium]|jgi:tetratricopeptide (TPR) repeat protein|nr:hypothetical protein [Pseudonocardiaceae bacterium]
MAADTPNETLSQLLACLSWSGERLAREICRVLGTGAVHPTAPYKWLKGHQPRRDEVRQAIAFVLSQASSRPVAVGELWPGCAPHDLRLVPAADGMEVPWTLAGTLAIIHDWLLGGLMDRRVFMAVGGSALTQLAWTAVNTEPARLAAALNGGQVGATLIGQVEETIPQLRQLDDQQGGGGANLTYVNAQFQVVGQLLRAADHGGQVTRRLLVALAELGQLAGWMAADCERHGLAQRYYLTALRAAHNVGDKPLGANVLSALAYHAASREQASDAISLGTAAVEMARRSPVTVQALVTSRLAYGYALVGDAERFHAAYGRARELSEHPTGHRPRWAYYVSPQFVDNAGGYYQVSLGMACSRNSRRHLDNAVTLLTPQATATPDYPYQRDALLDGTGLALAHLGRGELEQACEIGRIALRRLPQVNSPRCLASLGRLADELRGRKVNPHIREFSTELDCRLRLVA